MMMRRSHLFLYCALLFSFIYVHVLYPIQLSQFLYYGAQDNNISNNNNRTKQQLEDQNQQLQYEIDNLKDEINNLKLKLSLTNNNTGTQQETAITTTKTIMRHSSSSRSVVVPSMCRCSSGKLPIPYNISSNIEDVNIIQKGSIATGRVDKHFMIQKSLCNCEKKNTDNNNNGIITNDDFLKNMENQYCGGLNPIPHPDNLIRSQHRNKKQQHSAYYYFQNNNNNNNTRRSKMDWYSMPDFGVENKLPLFLGVLTYKSHQSLNKTLYNWEEHGLLQAGNFSQLYLQANARSKYDDQVINEHSKKSKSKNGNNNGFDFHVTGNETENIHPGLAIAKFCRQAEQSVYSHPNGENLLLFLEKDWHLQNHREDDGNLLLQNLFISINTLVQRGVPYVRLTEILPTAKKSNIKWKCNANGIVWDCTVAHQQRYTNLPSVIKCDWFLRYLEPYALISNNKEEEPIVYGCHKDFYEKKYCDWENLFQDGRAEWINSQWIVANYYNNNNGGGGGSPKNSLFKHHEVDQR